jgi:histidinol-phosphate aminotransferase
VVDNYSGRLTGSTAAGGSTSSSLLRHPTTVRFPGCAWTLPQGVPAVADAPSGLRPEKWKGETVLNPRDGILNIKPHMIATAAGDGANAPVNLASNESALGPSPKALVAARAALHSIERYPEDGAARLEKAIGATFGLDPHRIVCGHGSDELLGRLARAYLDPGDELIHCVHGYLKFPNYAHAMAAKPVAAPDADFRASVEGMLACVTPRTRMVMLANPDNPTGTFLGGEEIRRLHAGLPGNALLVLDSAYAEYVAAADYELPMSLIDDGENVVMTRTFSKIFGLAGMRLGWLYGPPAVVDIMRRLSITFPVSAPAVAAGIAAVGDRAHRDGVFAHNRDLLRWFTQALTDLGLHVYPSQANFVLIRFDDSARPVQDAYRYLFERGIVARMFASPDYRNMIRITIGLESEMHAAAVALRDYLRG